MDPLDGSVDGGSNERRCDLPFDSSDTVANEYTISIRSTLVAVCSELNGASVRRCSRRLEVLR